MKKRAQFYLIAAIAIITLILALVLVFNYSRSEDNLLIYELAEELDTESTKFLEYSAVSGGYDWRAFTSNFSRYAGHDVEIIYFVESGGTKDAFKYDEFGNYQVMPYTDNGNSVTISVADTDYTFQLREGEDFYYIISQYIGGERYVATNNE
jgi:hypothetical protein